jgi:hypothetical protein
MAFKKRPERSDEMSHKEHFRCKPKVIEILS